MPTPGILPAPSALSLSSPKQGKHQPKGKPLRHRQKSAPVQSFSRSGSSSPQPLLNCKSPKKGGGRQRPFPQPTEDSEDEYKSTTIPKQPGQASKRARPKGHRKKPSVVTPPPESQLPSENSTESLSRSLPSESFMSQQPGHSKSNNARRRIQEEADLWDTPAVSAIRSEAPTWQQSLFNGSDVPNNSANSSLKSRDDSLVGLKSGGVPAPPALTWQQELLQSSRPPSSAIRSLQPNHKAAATTAVSTGSPSKTRKQARRQSQPSSKPLTESDHASDSSGQAQELQGFSHLSLDETPSPAGSEVPSPSKPSKKKTPNKSKPRSDLVQQSTPQRSRRQQLSSKSWSDASSGLHTPPQSANSSFGTPAFARYAGPSFQHSPSASSLPTPSLRSDLSQQQQQQQPVQRSLDFA